MGLLNNVLNKTNTYDCLGGLMINIKRLKAYSLFCISFILLTLNSSFSAEILVAKIFKKTNNDQSNLFITTDDKSDVVKFRFDILDSQGELESSIPVSLKELRDGKVVLRKKGTNVISIKSTNVENHNGGHIQLTHLKQWRLFGSNKYRTIELVLDRVGDDWQILLNGEVFTELLADDHSKGINSFSIIK